MEISKNILVSALGSQPDIIEETVSFFNYSDSYDFYRNNPIITQLRESVCHVDEIWLVATDQAHIVNLNGRQRNSTLENYECIKKSCGKYGASIRIFILKGISDINSSFDANTFHSLTLSVVAFARQSLNGGKLYLSLACGRKTMSADMHDAAYCFGCDNLVHVLGDTLLDAQPILLGSVSSNEALKTKKLSFSQEEVLYCEPELEMFENIKLQKKEAQHFFTSYYLDEKETRSNFYILYTLPPSKIELLKKERIGIDKKKRPAEIKWLKRLPKTDLHCHLGGVLFPKDILNVATYLECFIDSTARENKRYAEWYENEFRKKYVDPKGLRSYANTLSKQLHVPKCCIVAPYIMRYNDNDALLKDIYGEYCDENKFCGISIETYEKLGDFQGSSLLDSIESIEATLDVLLKRCISENIKYIEIRCSPLNYAKSSGIPAEEFVLAMCSKLKNASKKIKSSLIFIVSRHREDMTKEYVNLVDMLKNHEDFKSFFRGFDVAGNESVKSPKEMREDFMEILKECYNITIHAGENQPVDNIWQAVYHLNAERIGHGLSLENNEDLLNKILERGIGIEMCPSSNFQIVGFRDNYMKEETSHLPSYPLKKYLDKDIIVSVNTDDPGISLTNMTMELHKAARLTEGGLSKWEILQIICNGFRSAFYPYEMKKQLIRSAESELGELIKKDLL